MPTRGPLASTTHPTVQLYAVTTEGPAPLPVRAGVRNAHELFDDLPLGVYSALRTFDHERFLGLEHHFERTDRSLELLGWRARLDRDSLRRALHETVRAFPGAEAFVRFDVLAEEPRGLGTLHKTLLALSLFTPVPEHFLREGVGVRFSPLRRERPLIKTARFVLERRPYPLGSQEAYEHLLVDARGRILEGTSSNFLALEDGVLHMAGDEALQGVTQRYVGEIASEMGLRVVREPVLRSGLSRVQEAFLTGSTRGVVPVVAIEGVRIGDGRPGPWTERLLSAYLDFARAHASPALPIGQSGPARPGGD